MPPFSSRSVLERPGILAGIFIGSLFFITQITFSALSPEIPTIGDSFNLSSETSRLIITYGFSGYMVGQLVWGPLSDILGRSPVILTNLALYALAAVLATLSSNGLQLMLAYTAMGFLAATYTSVGNAVLKDRYKGDDYVKMVANIGIVMAMGPIVGPSLSGLLSWLSGSSWHPAFYMLAATALAGLAGYAMFARYQPTKSAKPLERGSFAALFGNWRFFVALFSFALTFGILISYLATGPYLLMKHYGVSHHSFPVWYGMTTVCYLLGAVVFRRYSSLWTPVSALFWGSLVALTGAASLLVVTILLPQQMVPGILSLGLMLGGIGIAVPSGKAETMGQVKSAFGLGASVMKFGQSACAVGVSACAAFLFSPDQVIPFMGLYAGICLLALLGSICLKKLTHPESRVSTELPPMPH